MRNRFIPAALAMVFLTGLSPLSAQSRIHRGVDAFTTPADGKTHYDFGRHPIPAGFFCDRSAAFTDPVAFKGLPLATATPGQLWGADTVIERLDDAVFDAKGAATTRIRFRALSLVSIAPIKTACGAFHVYVSLAGPQRVTPMSLSRTQKNGGSFVAPLAVDARLTFVPVKAAKTKNPRPLMLTASITFPGNALPWSLKTDTTMKRMGAAVVDTDGDLTPDSLLPGDSGFSPGVSPSQFNEGGNCPCSELSCHAGDGDEHCYYPTTPGCAITECAW